MVEKICKTLVNLGLRTDDEYCANAKLFLDAIAK